MRASGPADAEGELLDDLRRGDEAAFERLVRLHGGRMLAVARRFLPEEEDARDAVQDALLQASRGIARFAGSARLGTWLHRIVVNASLMKLRTRRRRPEEPLDPLLPVFADDGNHATPVAAWSPDALEGIERAELRELVRRNIARLPESHRTVLLLRDVEELDTEETSYRLGLPVATVKTRLHRARQALRTLLAAELGEGRDRGPRG